MLTLNREDVFDIVGDDFTGKYRQTPEHCVGGPYLRIELNWPEGTKPEIGHGRLGAFYNCMSEEDFDRLCSAAKMAWRKINNPT